MQERSLRKKQLRKIRPAAFMAAAATFFSVLPIAEAKLNKDKNADPNAITRTLPAQKHNLMVSPKLGNTLINLDLNRDDKDDYISSEPDRKSHTTPIVLSALASLVVIAGWQLRKLKERAESARKENETRMQAELELRIKDLLSKIFPVCERVDSIVIELSGEGNKAIRSLLKLYETDSVSVLRILSVLREDPTWRKPASAVLDTLVVD